MQILQKTMVNVNFLICLSYILGRTVLNIGEGGARFRILRGEAGANFSLAVN